MERQSVKVCLVMEDCGSEYGVYILTTAAKILSELRAGRQDSTFSADWKLAPPECGICKQIVLCGSVEYRNQCQLEAYLSYIQNQICDIIDDRKGTFHLQVGACQGNGVSVKSSDHER